MRLKEVCYKCGLVGRMEVFPCWSARVGIPCKANLCYACRAISFRSPLTGTIISGVCPDCELAIHEKAVRDQGFDLLDNGPRKRDDVIFYLATVFYKARKYGPSVGLEETYELLKRAMDAYN